MAFEATKRCILGCALVAALSGPLAAVPPSERLFPETTRAFVSAPDLNRLRQNWSRTQFGQLVEDEAMQPFVADLRRQLRSKVGNIENKFGLTLDDLRDVAGGEVAMAMIEPAPTAAALAIAIDVTDHLDEAHQLLAKVSRTLAQRNAKETSHPYGQLTITEFEFVLENETTPRQAYYIIHNELLIATDDRDEMNAILGRIEGQQLKSLADLPAYQTTMARCERESGGISPELRWFIDPFGYARAARAMAGGKRRRGKDIVKILSTQGFDAIQGAGGMVSFAVNGEYEIVHRTAVHAPPVAGKEKSPEKYDLAMRMMKFPNASQLSAQNWVPRDIASYRTFSWDMQHAFQYFGTLFDAFAGHENAFQDVIEGMERDPYGAQVSIPNEFIAHLGQRVTLVTDYQLPITVESERFLFVISLKNPDQMSATIDRIMDTEPNAEPREFQGITIWENVAAETEVDAVELQAPSLNPFDETEFADDVADDEPALPNSAVCVTDGQLFIASHIDYLKQVLESAGKTASLGQHVDYRLVSDALDRLAGQEYCMRGFIRADEAYRPTYELLRQGKMPESQTLLGRLLNRLLTEEDADDEILREQKIDGSKLPEFEMVRRYFGPGGTSIRSEPNGWFIVGAALSKEGKAVARREVR